MRRWELSTACLLLFIRSYDCTVELGEICSEKLSNVETTLIRNKSSLDELLRLGIRQEGLWKVELNSSSRSDTIK